MVSKNIKLKALSAACALFISDFALSAISLEEVVVTAQRRSENQQDVPIAISTISGDELQAKGLTDVSSIGGITPNATIKNTASFGGSSSILVSYIRGIGQNDFAFNLEPGVGVYIDGVYLARNIGANVDLLDIQNIEVLKGPQGTLFGRNTIGGALNIVTRDPGNEFMAKGEVTVGSDNRREFRGIMDIPLVDNELSLGVAISKKDRDGYQKRIPYTGDTGNNPILSGLGFPSPVYTNTDEARRFPLVDGAKFGSESGDQDSLTSRFKLVWTPNDDLTAKLSGDYQKVDQAAAPFSLVRVDQEAYVGAYNTCLAGPAAAAGFDAVVGPTIGAAPTGMTDLCSQVRGNPASPAGTAPSLFDEALQHLPYDNRYVLDDPDKSYASGANFDQVEAWGVALDLDYALTDGMSVRSITAYRELDSAFGVDVGGAPFSALAPTFEDDEEQFSQEFHLSGVTWDDKWNYLIGAYYFHEEGTHDDGVPFTGGLLQVWSTPNEYETDAYAIFMHNNIELTERWGVTFGVRYTEEDKKFTGSQRDENGFTAALFGVPSFAYTNNDIYQLYPLVENQQDFEDVSYRVGAEYRLDPNIMIYGSFATGYKGGGWTTRLLAPELDAPTFDPEEAETIELGVKSELLDGRVRLNAAIFQTSYDDIQLTFVDGPSPVTANGGDGTINGLEVELQAVLSDFWLAEVNVGYLDAEYDSINPGVILRGDEDFVNTPEWKVHIGTSYVLDTSVGEFTSRIDWMFQTEVYNDEANTPILRTPSYSITNFSIAYAMPDSEWEVVAGVTNMFDKRIIQSGFSNAEAIYSATYNRPREGYLTLRKTF